jgi:6-phosphogluconolactonase/glucosamine-6-phosphate isomerase/deaminase
MESDLPIKNLIVFKTADEVFSFVEQWCDETLKSPGVNSLYLPAGNTPIPLYQRWTKNKPAYLKQTKLLQIDDVTSGEKAGLFKKFFKQHLPKHYKKIQPITQGPFQADAGILGLGLNGHIAFHEPHLPRDFSYGEMELDSKTCHTLELVEGTRGMSYGLGAFMNTQRLILIVLGENKQEILARVLNREDVPASHLLDHHDITIVCDTKAYGNIE